jgi:signal transduction histidine kinase
MALVGGMADLISSTSGPNIDVRVRLADDLPPAVADANQLEMAILNLAVNARDAMPDGGILTISAARESVRPGHRSKLRQGHYVRLSVADTGIGMDQATLSRAIEPFYSTKGIGKGRASGSPWCTAWPLNSRVDWQSPARRAKVPRSTCGCPSAS